MLLLMEMMSAMMGKLEMQIEKLSSHVQQHSVTSLSLYHKREQNICSSLQD